MKTLMIAISCILTFQVLAQYKTEIYVEKDGSGDFTSIQAAIDETKSYPDKPVTIFIGEGVFNEKVRVYAWNTDLKLIGTGPAKTIIRWDDHFKKINKGRNSTFLTATLTVEANGFQAFDLSVENTAGPVGQAIAVALYGDKCSMTRCVISGHQDTLFAAGQASRQHYKDCIISGTTDFIFGPATAVFEQCTILSLADSYITAASTPAGRAFGLVFIQCQLTAAEGVRKVFLGRPWRPYAKTAFINCKMGSHINPEGWDNWGDPENEKTTYYTEYNNTGPGSTTDQRVDWAVQLTNKQARAYQPDKIFGSVSLEAWEIDQHQYE